MPVFEKGGALTTAGGSSGLLDPERGEVHVNDNGILAGTGIVRGNVTVTGSGQDSPGLSPGTIIIEGNYAQGPEGVLKIEFAGLAVEVRRSFKARDVLDVLSELMLIRGVPRHIRSDNGPEFIAQAIRSFLGQTGVETLYIEPGAPWQNAYAESFNSRFRAELLSQESFADLAEAKQVSGWWQNHYNHRRPHSSLNYQPPARFAASLGTPPLRLRSASGLRPSAALQRAQRYNQPTHRLSLRLAHSSQAGHRSHRKR